jgi:hypothetical protein
MRNAEHHRGGAKKKPDVSVGLIGGLQAFTGTITFTLKEAGSQPCSAFKRSPVAISVAGESPVTNENDCS